MQHPVLVTERSSLEELKHETPNSNRIQRSPIPMNIHVLFEILIHVLENEHQLRFSVNDIVQSDNVAVTQLFHQGDLADRSRGRAFFGIEMDLFQGDDLRGVPRATLQGGSGQVVSRESRK